MKHIALAIVLTGITIPAFAQGCIGGAAGDMCRVQQFQQQRNQDYQQQQNRFDQSMRDLATQRYRMQQQ